MKICGFNSLSKIKDNIKVSHYITKYISKDICKTSSGYSYFHSQNLITPVYTEIDYKGIIQFLDLTFENDFVKKFKMKGDYFE